MGHGVGPGYSGKGRGGGLMSQKEFFLGNGVCAWSTKRTSETMSSPGGGEDKENTGYAVTVGGNCKLPKAGSRALSSLVEK